MKQRTIKYWSLKRNLHEFAQAKNKGDSILENGSFGMKSSK